MKREVRDKKGCKIYKEGKSVKYLLIYNQINFRY